MIWAYLWIIATIVAIIYGICNAYGILEKIKYAIGYGLVAFIIGVFPMCWMQKICYSPSDKLELQETQKVYSLKDNAYLSGHGNFISVRIEENDRYTYMVVNEDNTYSKKTIKSNNVKIKEVDDCKEATLEVYMCESKNEFWSIWSEENYCFVFVVPKGTVVNTFSIDLE